MSSRSRHATWIACCLILAGSAALGRTDRESRMPPAQPPGRLAVGSLHMPPDPRLGLVPLEPVSDQEGPGRRETGADRDWWGRAAAANPDWWPSVAPDRLLANERRVLAGAQGPTDRATTVARVLVLPVEFAGAETLTYRQQDASRKCVTVTQEHAGPLHGRIPYPGGSVTETIDNQTVFYPSTEPGDYARLVFGRQGYTVPLRAGDPNVNDGAGIDISGLTVQAYFDAQSDGTVEITGTVAPWVTNPHSEAWYGIDRCVSGGAARAMPDDQLGSKAELVTSAAEALKARGAPYAAYGWWKQFDGDDDGVVDALWVIHAGRGQEYGGGSEGDAAIWSRANHVGAYAGFPEDGWVVHDNGTPDSADDIRIGSFTEVPEDADLGVLIEEFGHAFFGLPDLYTSDAANSNGWWAPMSSGIYGGELAGTRPVNMPLWFRMTADCGGQPCGWADPMAVVSHTTDSQVYVIGEAGSPAGGVVTEGALAGETIHEGLRVDLPEQTVEIANRAGTGAGAWSGSEVGEARVLGRRMDLPAGGPVLLTMRAWWQIRAHAGFGHVMVSTDGTEWTTLPDMDGRTTAENRYGINRGHGLTGSGSGLLRYDLSSFAGRTIDLAILYQDWLGPSEGWWIDDVSIAEGIGDNFEDGFAAGWEVTGWTVVPMTLRYPQYYLVEWRSPNGFDASLLGAYATSYSGAGQWRVDRLKANVPGAVVWYRNTRYPFSNSLLTPRNDPPSVGPKWGLLVVDTSYWPTNRPSGGALAGSLESLNAALSAEGQPGYALELRDPSTGQVEGTEAITGTIPVTRFDDARGYVPGFAQDPAVPESTPAAVDADAGVVVPSLGGAVYSTRITGPGRSRPHPLDGSPAGPGGHYFGSGDPGDANLQLGVRIDLVGQASDGSWGAVRVSNVAMDHVLLASADRWLPGRPITLTAISRNRGAVEACVHQDPTYRLPGQLGYSAWAAGGGTVAAGDSLTLVAQLPESPTWPTAPGADPSLSLRVEFRRADRSDPDAECAWDGEGEVWMREVTLGPPIRVFLPTLRRE